MITDDKRDLWKAHNHVIELCRQINRLKCEKLSVSEFSELLNRIQKHAHLSSSRIGKVAGQIGILDRMEMANESYELTDDIMEKK